MPRNGSGTYQLPAGNPVVTGTTISSSGWANPTLADIASALTASIAVDGQTVPTANLPMGNFRHLNVANGQNPNEYATVGQIQNAGFTLLGANTGTINTTKSISTSSVISATAGIQVFSNGAPLDKQGLTVIWNEVSGSGATSLVNNQGTGGGGFILRNVNSSNTIETGRVTIGGNGSIVSTGTISGTDITGSSDERLKEDWAQMSSDFLVRMSKVLHGTFSWKADGSRSAGVGAASLRDAFPEVVHEDARGMLSVSYGHAALVTVLELIPIVLRLLDAHGETP